jgi:chromosome segregation protein
MFLKSLVLRGFKTFAEPTEIEFSPEARITAIVGPNGCGKSNLMDGTRWVLGEENTRELRVAALSNIIFAGTANRKPLSLAEVSLVFDNTSAKLPLPYSEVVVKRRTFREGESEFYINKNPCRLKDIKDLLLDTGLGEATYSIITQGRVDAILSSKGEERRAVFEEAAGINKYKTRKLAAEKKLIAAEQNILRLNDLKVEVSEQLVVLEEQARKAREYLELQKRVKEIEIGLAKKLIGNLSDKRAKLVEELENMRRVVQEKLDAEKRTEAELESVRAGQRRIEGEMDELHAELDTEKDRLRDLELNRRFSESELQRENRRQEELVAKAEEIRRKIEEQRSPAETTEVTIDFAEQSEWKLIVEQTVRLFRQLSEIMIALGANMPFSLIGQTEKEESRQFKIGLLQEEEKRINDELERVKFGLHAYRLELEKQDRELTASSKTALEDKIAALRQERERLIQKITELEEKLKSEIHSEGSSTALEVAIAKLEGEMNGLCDKIYLEYNLSLEEIQRQPYEAANLSRARSEVDEGKQRLRALEPINLLAIDEYDRTRERLSFLDEQLMDLNNARESLRNLISELDLRAEENFVSTMQQLSQVFSETFSRLFNGGEAKIALLPGTSPLEAEIEISVRPAGRKWLPLPLLSGGERALSAIAILFSLLKIRPSPFCFLDEVDAALDEANIIRFTEILKDFSNQSQIVVITHNKRTMAVAHQIYGITMEEPGVSRVISMRLAEAAV